MAGEFNFGSMISGLGGALFGSQGGKVGMTNGAENAYSFSTYDPNNTSMKLVTPDMVKTFDQTKMDAYGAAQTASGLTSKPGLLQNAISNPLDMMKIYGAFQGQKFQKEQYKDYKEQLARQNRIADDRRAGRLALGRALGA